MAKDKTVFYCQNCGYKSPRWLGKCPECSAWNTFEEERIKKENKYLSDSKISAPEKIKEIQFRNEDRILSGYKEVDRVLGGGFVNGEFILLAGEPGIGKSTLILQLTKKLGEKHKVLYCSGEESKEQIKLRAERIGFQDEDVYILAENNFESILYNIEKEAPEFLIVDSIQTVFTEELDSAPGTVSQAKDISAKLLKVAKEKNIVTIVIGHVTKDGNIAGPKVLEHIVDVVLYFEGEKNYQYRTLRSYKNRFGSSSELGIFEMEETGLREVLNPSEFLLQEKPEKASGSAITTLYEGSRAILLEVQALVSDSYYNQARRVTSGFDYNRINMIIAILEKKAGLKLSQSDVFVNIVGGIKASDPGIDLAIATAIASSFKDRMIQEKTIIIGELGLTGENRSVSNIEKRIKEAEKLGFKRVIIPFSNKINFKSNGLEISRVKNIKEALDFAIC